MRATGRMRSLGAALMGVILAFAAMPAPAQDEELPLMAPRAVAEELSAIARLRSGLAPRGGCSAVLIAPQLALTAAHCAANGSPLMNPLMMIFGPDDEPPALRMRVVDVSHHVDYGLEERSIHTLYSDLAVLHLEAPIPRDIATPIPLADFPDQPFLGAAREGAIFGYRNGGGDILHGHPRCQLATVLPALLASDCLVVSGFSGTAVLSGPPGNRRLEGIAVARSFQDDIKALIADVVPWPEFRDGTPPPLRIAPSEDRQTSP